MFIDVPILNPLSNHLRISAIETNGSTTAIDNVTLEFVSNSPFEWC